MAALPNASPTRSTSVTNHSSTIRRPRSRLTTTSSSTSMLPTRGGGPNPPPPSDGFPALRIPASDWQAIVRRADAVVALPLPPGVPCVPANIPHLTMFPSAPQYFDDNTSVVLQLVADAECVVAVYKALNQAGCHAVYNTPNNQFEAVYHSDAGEIVRFCVTCCVWGPASVLVEVQRKSGCVCAFVAMFHRFLLSLPDPRHHPSTQDRFALTPTWSPPPSSMAVLPEAAIDLLFAHANAKPVDVRMEGLKLLASCCASSALNARAVLRRLTVADDETLMRAFAMGARTNLIGLAEYSWAILARIAKHLVVAGVKEKGELELEQPEEEKAKGEREFEQSEEAEADGAKSGEAVDDDPDQQAFAAKLASLDALLAAAASAETDNGGARLAIAKAIDTIMAALTEPQRTLCPQLAASRATLDATWTCGHA